VEQQGTTSESASKPLKQVTAGRSIVFKVDPKKLDRRIADGKHQDVIAAWGSPKAYLFGARIGAGQHVPRRGGVMMCLGKHRAGPIARHTWHLHRSRLIMRNIGRPPSDVASSCGWSWKVCCTEWVAVFAGSSLTIRQASHMFALSCRRRP
jgi:hypothetical protein